ncbi:hypothetical protein C922_03974 [Plasmodium inui San Antonio 1]|uniref:Inner membrane complex protein 1a n=1 Tax=Plasmodium inui San Antonio 1 TaxID=1237626 RepID=W7AK65_9APIC|nr:hypothetical protein C922_03974 [Plasmodium inui San Antonio 1]EUD65726.1 hypothetical protein C922_03974 [Plasmodium inui San Antonio 1]
MFNACKGKSNCCREESEETKKLVHEGGRHDLFDQHLVKENGDFKKIIEGEPDQTKAVEISQRTEREYVAVTAYQPVDIVTRTVEVPFVRTIETTVPKITYENKIREVPKYYSKIVEKIVEVPEVKFVDKIVDVPRIQYCFKYVPKVEVKENIIQRPVIQKKIVEKIVEVPKVKEMQRFQEVETVEYVIKYVPKGFTEGRKKSDDEDEDGEEKKEEDPDEERDRGQGEEANEEQEDDGNSRFYGLKNYSEGAKLVRNAQMGMNQSQLWEQTMSMGKDKMFPYVFSRPMQGQAEGQVTAHAGIGTPWGSALVGGELHGEAYEGGAVHPTFDLRKELSLMQLKERNGSMLPTPRIEQVFKPKIVKNIEVQKHVPISVDVPVPYMVPKPVVVNVEVPVLKFRDTFVPVPVRRKIIPKIKWISDVYQVDCIKEKPYLKIQDVIKPIPCDVQIKYRKYMEKACAVNPNELPQDDVHCMWMRVNAHLAEQKKREYGDLYPYYRGGPEGEGENDSRSSGRDEQDGSEGTECSEEGTMHEGEIREGVLDEEGEVSGTASKQEEGGEDKEERAEGQETIGSGKDGVNERSGAMEQTESAMSNGEIIQIGEVAQQGSIIGVLRREYGEIDQTKAEEWRQVEGIEKVSAEQNIFYAYEGSEQMQKEGRGFNVCCKNSNDRVSGTPANEDRYNLECVDEFMKEMKKQDHLEEEGAVASLYPSHPLAMTYLQNKWIQTDTLRTHELYHDDFVRASINANFNLNNRNPVISEVMRNQDFLKTANPIISPFFPRNIQNIENSYNRVIVQNIQEENMRCQGGTNKYEQKVHGLAGDTDVRMYDEGAAGCTGQACGSGGKSCSYFCKQ